MKNLNQPELFYLAQKEGKLKDFVTLATARAYKGDAEPTLHFDGVLETLDINVSLRNRPDLHDWLHDYFAAKCDQMILKHELAVIEREIELHEKPTQTGDCGQEDYLAAIEEAKEGWGQMPF